MTRWQWWAPGIALAAGCIFNGVLVGRKVMAVPLRAPVESVPAVQAGVLGRDVRFSADAERVAGMSTYVYRQYQSDSLPYFDLYVGYYEMQQQGKTIHSPKNCLPGGGWEMVDVEPKTFQSPLGPITVSRNVIAKPGGSAVVYYWYQGRGRVAYDEFRIKYELLRDAFLTGRTEEALVRIIIYANNEKDVGPADALAARLVPQLAADVDRILPVKK